MSYFGHVGFSLRTHTMRKLHSLACDLYWTSKIIGARFAAERKHTLPFTEVPMIRLLHIHGAITLADRTVQRKRKVNRFRRLLRFDTSRNRLPVPFANRQTAHTPQNLSSLSHPRDGSHPSCALAHERGPRPGNDGLLRGNHADDHLQNFRHLRRSRHLFRRIDLRRHPHDVAEASRTLFRDSSARCSAPESWDGAPAGLARSPARRCSRWRP